MAIQLKFFIVPVREIEAAETQINRFLRSVRVVHLHREFVAQGDNSFWSLAVEYLTDGDRPAHEKGSGAGRSRIDYREVLPPEEFAVFVKLREWRKQQAAKEAVPVYTIFTNVQLAAIAENKISTRAGLKQIDGIGEARIEKYGDAVIRIMTEPNQGDENEAGRRAVSADSHL
jgi:superfamily II DNA helicase RecQ